MNVSEFDNVSEATDTLVSALQAFKDESVDADTLSTKIIDVFNQIGNSYAISTSDLADSLTRSSASLVAANNTLEQSVALTTAANTTIQNPEVVGTTLKTLAMRIRGVKSELEEAGEDTEGMITNTSKLQAKVQALTNIDGSGGVNILANSNEFKSTYDILLEISKVWDKMSDVDQAALLEIIAGKRAGSAVASILSNGDILANAYRDALGADGSAQQELNTYLDSIQGKLDQLSNSTQTMWMNFMDSDVLKFLINMVTSLVNATDSVGLLNAALSVFFAKTALNADSFGQFFKFDPKAADGVKKFTFSLKGAATNAKGLGIGTKAAAIGTQLLNSAISMGISLIAGWAIGKLFTWIDDYIHRVENLREEVKELNDEYQDTKQKFADNLSTLTESSGYTTLLAEFEQLTKGVNKYGENISLTSDQYERYKEICESIVGINPSIAAGYDSATKAIGNNAGVLERLIELQKEQARLNAAEFVSYGAYADNGNFGKMAENVINEVQKAKVNLSKTLNNQTHDNGMDLKSVLPSIFGLDERNIKHIPQVVQNTMKMLGYAQEDIDNVLSEMRQVSTTYYAEAGMYVTQDLFDVDKWLGQYADEIFAAEDEFIAQLENDKELAMIDALPIEERLSALQEKMQAEYDQTPIDLTARVNVSAETMKASGWDIGEGNYATVNSISAYASEFGLSDENGTDYAINLTPILPDGTVIDGGEAGLKNWVRNQLQGGAKLEELDVFLGSYRSMDDAIAAAERLHNLQEAYYASEKLSALQVVQTAEDAKKFLSEYMGYSADDASDTVDSRTYTGRIRGFNPDKFKKDFTSEISPEMIGKSAEEIDQEIAAFKEAADAYAVNKASLESARDSMIDVFLQVPYAIKGYGDLSNESQSFFTEWIKNSPLFKIDETSTMDSIVAAKQTIIDTINGVLNDAYTTEIEVNGNKTTVSAKTLIDSLFSIDTSDMEYSSYKAEIQTLITRLYEALGESAKTLGFEDKNALAVGLGFEFVFDEDPAITAFKEDVARITKNEMSPEEIEQWIDSLGYSDLQALLKIDWDVEAADSLTLQEMLDKAMPKVEAENVVTVSTYSTLAEGVESYKEVLAQTSEVVSDNTKVTQEYRDALDQLGISEALLNECFDENDKLMVKDAKQLNKLVKGAKKNTAQNIKLAKSQAKLEYYELYKQMRDFALGLELNDKGYKVLTDSQEAQLNSLYEEMNAIQEAIARFSMLEAQLLGVTNAYTKFTEAQTMDEENEYSLQAEGMVEAFATALNTGDLGTETARAAMLGLVPEEVYKDLDTVEEKLDAIAKYFNEGELSKYFSIDFDDDGNVEKVDITPNDLKQFFEDGRKAGVFTGNWEHFDLAEDVTSLEQFAKAMNITEEVAFAMFEALENHDAGNLFDPSNILDKFMSGNIEYQAYENAKAMSELQYQLANGTISAEEYAKKMVGLDGQLAAGAITQDEYKTAVANLKKQLEDGTITQQEYNEAVLGLANQQDKIAEDAYNQATAYYDKSKALEECNKKLKEYSDLLSDEDGLDKDGNPIDKEQVAKDIDAVSKEIETLMADLEVLGEPTEMTLELASEHVQGEIDDFKKNIDELASRGHVVSIRAKTVIEKIDTEGFEALGLSKDSNGNWTGVAELLTSMGLSDDDATIKVVTDYLNLVDSQHTLDVLLGDGAATVEETLENILATLQDIASKLGTDYTLKVNTKLDTSPVKSFLNTPLSKTISVGIKKVGDWLSGWFANGTVHADGTAHVSGAAHARGSWGAPKTETALVGELGPEIVVRNGKWTTVGDNGAEFANIKKGDIIFNHKQTEDLLSKGYVTGRGKAYAEGTAYNGIYTYDKYRNKESKAYKGSTVASSLSKAAKDISKASDKLSDDFKEIFDWIEVRIEEITNAIEIRNSKLENAVGSAKQNAIIDDIIDLNQKLYDNLTAGASKYYEYSSKLLEKVPAEYRKAAQDGSIAIESFTGKVGESTLEAIKDYREWVQKGDEATQQAEETLTEISSLAKQAIDNIAADYENKVSLRDNKISQYEAYNALLETDVGYESAKIYQAMIKETNQNLKTLEEQRNKMQAELDKRVQSGEIKKYSQDWYDAVNSIAEIDTQMIELKTDTEDWQDAINELHWDQLDDLMSKLEAVSDEADNLIDILGNKDAVDEAANWTKEGITSLGLYAQKMEVAEMQAKKYKDEITYLNKNWKKLGYTEQEYVKKLEELKSAQYDAIKAYHDTKDAIVDLNKERVEAIKTIIQEEIDAYTELIEKKKEELSAEKDLYDFQKGVKEQQKDIADIERKLAAISSDNSASARAERARLQAELAEANAALEDTYYDRSISNQQEALDKELENFQEEKDKEIEGWEEYLENTELVVSDSLAVIQSNTDTVYQTLRDMGAEYSLSITEALTSPWKQGESAIQSYTEKFKLNMSATVEELKELMTEFNAIVVDLEKDGTAAVNTVNNSATKYQAATKKPAASSGGNSSSGSSSNSSSGSGSGETGGSYPYGKASNTSGNIKQGAKGNHVKAIQYALNQLGYGNSGTKSVDGIFGSGTTKAVKSFQKAMGISADGIVGAQTRQKFKAKGYAQGTAGVKEDQWALIDELGEELVLHAQNGKLAFLTKGSAVVPHDIAENIIELGQLDPSMILERNKPQIGLPSEIHNTEINIDNSIAELIHIDNCSTETLPDVKKIVNDALEKHTKQLNNSLKKFVR